MRPFDVTVAPSDERVCSLLVATMMATFISVEVFDVRLVTSTPGLPLLFSARFQKIHAKILDVPAQNRI